MALEGAVKALRSPVARVTAFGRITLPLALSCALATSCAPARYVLPGATRADDAANDAACTLNAITSVSPSNLPWVGYHHHRSAGDGLGLLLAVMLDQAVVNAERDRVREGCLVAMGYREAR